MSGDGRALGDGRAERAGAARAGRGRRHPPPGDPDAVSGRARQCLPDRGLAADADRLGAELGQGAGRARTGAGRARTRDRGHRAAGDHPPAHRPLRPGLDPRAALRRRGRGAGRARALSARLRHLDRARRPLRPGDHAPARHPRRRRHRAAGGLRELSRLGLGRRDHPAAARRRGAAPARPHAARAAPARPQPVGHGVPRRVPRDPARRRPPDRPHLLQPAARTAARRWTRLRRARARGR